MCSSFVCIQIHAGLLHLAHCLHITLHTLHYILHISTEMYHFVSNLKTLHMIELFQQFLVQFIQKQLIKHEIFNILLVFIFSTFVLCIFTGLNNINFSHSKTHNVPFHVNPSILSPCTQATHTSKKCHVPLDLLLLYLLRFYLCTFESLHFCTFSGQKEP